ncbi:hypothetical protein FGB62_67g07 [Gracilaria domingensis]|nr:hypothetical protein FGB62_67g07 [Gracilaria domingensis]
MSSAGFRCFPSYHFKCIPERIVTRAPAFRHWRTAVSHSNNSRVVPKPLQASYENVSFPAVPTLSTRSEVIDDMKYLPNRTGSTNLPSSLILSQPQRNLTEDVEKEKPGKTICFGYSETPDLQGDDEGYEMDSQSNNLSISGASEHILIPQSVFASEASDEEVCENDIVSHFMEDDKVGVRAAEFNKFIDSPDPTGFPLERESDIVALSESHDGSACSRIGVGDILHGSASD